LRPDRRRYAELGIPAAWGSGPRAGYTGQVDRSDELPPARPGTALRILATNDMGAAFVPVPTPARRGRQIRPASLSSGTAGSPAAGSSPGSDRAARSS
jgi:hypothetical protein